MRVNNILFKNDILAAINLCTSVFLDSYSEADLRIKTKKDRIGSKYMKVVYKQYTDATFTQEIPPPAHHG